MSAKSLVLSITASLCLFAGNLPATEHVPAQAADNTIPVTSAPGSVDDSSQDSTAATLRDVILVIDNSGSMKQNDPRFLAKEAVKEFVSRLDTDTRLGIIIFDQGVRMAMPLTVISEQGREQVAQSLDQINYQGQLTDSPAAIERAIYELKNSEREEAGKFIVFMTDGIVDTGNADRDVERNTWLREDLASDATESDIRIFGIAFTENADFQLIQSLAQNTDGEYFRALEARELPGVFDRIYTFMQRPPESEETATTAPPPPEPQPLPAPLPQPLVINVPEQAPSGMGEEERIRSIIIITAAIALMLALLVIIAILVRRSKEARRINEEQVTEAYLNDTHSHTAQSSYKLGSRPTMLGRVAGRDTDHLDYIVIPETTIGRRHALIEYKDYAYWIVDQGSINGTFVNDVPISSEVRLKHGDTIRLYKFEFEFIMPEMDDAGMTVMSNTVFAQDGGVGQDDVTALKGHRAAVGNGDMDLDFDFSRDVAQGDIGAADEDGTILYDDVDEDRVTDDGVGYSPEDETLMPGSYEGGDDAKDRQAEGTDDETLLPAESDLPNDEATLRSDSEEDVLNDFFDLDDADDQEDKDGDNDKK